MNTTLSRDEFFQVLLFLPASDVSHFSQINSTAYDGIISDQGLWTVLLKRDFALVMEQRPQQGSTGQQSFLLTPTDTTLMVGQHCCEAMRDYVCTFLRFHQFPFDRVDPRSMYDTTKHTTSKIMFHPDSNSLNQSVIDVLMHQQFSLSHESYREQIGVDVTPLFMASRQPEMTPNLIFQFWKIGQVSKPRSAIARAYYLGTQCLVISVDTNHAWNEDSYSPCFPHGCFSENSLSRGLAGLTESKSLLNLVPPDACKGVLIVGIGAWPEAAPISKQRFLKDCAQSFDVLPLEYFELTENNATVLSDVLLRWFYTFHQQAAIEDIAESSIDINSPNRYPCSK